MDNSKFTFKKKEKLCSRKVISHLFENGNSFYSEPFRVQWLRCDDKLPFPVLTAISVGKKSFPEAVSRNRIKRLIREVWRLNKQHLYLHLKQMNLQLYIMIIYSGKKIPEYNELDRQMRKLVESFSAHLKTVIQNNYSS